MAATAALYRMVLDDHLCPSGLKAYDLLRRRGFDIEDHPLRTRAQVDAFKAEHDVATTPQVWIGGQRIGGYDALAQHLGIARDPDAVTYRPVIAIFATTAMMALAICWNLYPGLPFDLWLAWFVAFSMAALAIQKLRDLDGFVTGFLGYDLLARRWVPYARAYPFLEAWAGIGMMAVIGRDTALAWAVAPVSLFIGTVGAVSVIYAVYIQKRDLKCACVGGASNVPLGFVSLTENLMMAGMGAWTILRLLA